MTSYSPFIETIYLSCSILNIVSYSFKVFLLHVQCYV